MECPLDSPLMDMCAVEDQKLWNESSYLDGSFLTDGNMPVPSPASSYNEPSRTFIHNLFRRAADSHGFGWEYQSDLKDLLAQSGGNSWAIWIVLPATLLIGFAAHLGVKKIFGRMRMSERQHTRERLWNYAFYKFIFVFGAVMVESVEEMIIWVDWFIVLGYIHFLIVLSRDRCEAMALSPVSANMTQKRITMLLAAVIGVSFLIFGLSAILLWIGFLHTGLFVATEGLLVLFPTCHILLRYDFHYLREGRSAAKWEKRTGLRYYLNLFCEAGHVFLDLCHHVHMMLQVSALSASSLVFVAQIRFLTVELVTKYQRHRSYTAIQSRLQTAFPVASSQEIVAHDGPCAICWDTLEVARKLHCGHLFHEACLLSWLEQDISCPICRVSLSDTFDMGGQRPGAARRAAEETARNYTFQGSRINRWLPNVSVTVTHPVYEYLDANNSIEAMADQVRRVFPAADHQAVIQDLLETGSAEMTIDNILSGASDFTRPAISDLEDLGVHTVVSPTSSNGGALPGSTEACRAMQIQRKETIFREARKNFQARIAKEKSQLMGTADTMDGLQSSSVNK